MVASFQSILKRFRQTRIVVDCNVHDRCYCIQHQGSISLNNNTIGMEISDHNSPFVVFQIVI
jgi:hypothetical protein